MPITSIGSFRATSQEFVVNWALANGELGSSPIVLAGNYSQADFVADREALLAAMEIVADSAAAARATVAACLQGKINLHARGKQFRGEVQGQVTDAAYLRDLPTMEQPSADCDKFCQPLRAMARLWARINDNAASLGMSGPLTLAGGYTLAQFQSDLQALPLLNEATESAEGDWGQARGERDNKAVALHERMKQYRKLAPVRLPANSPALARLPRLSPEPGTTPSPVLVNGVWESSIGKARLTWAAATASNIEKLQVRAYTGGSYKNDDEEIIADLPAGAAQWEGDWGLTVPGAIASFKVYVMTSSGNENGGKAVKIVRPVV